MEEWSVGCGADRMRNSETSASSAEPCGVRIWGIRDWESGQGWSHWVALGRTKSNQKKVKKDGREVFLAKDAKDAKAVRACTRHEEGTSTGRGARGRIIGVGFADAGMDLRALI